MSEGVYRWLMVILLTFIALELSQIAGLIQMLFEQGLYG